MILKIEMREYVRYSHEISGLEESRIVFSTPFCLFLSAPFSQSSLFSFSFPLASLPCLLSLLINSLSYLDKDFKYHSVSLLSEVLVVTKQMHGVNFWLQSRSGNQNCSQRTLSICLILRIPITNMQAFLSQTRAHITPDNGEPLVKWSCSH